MKLIKSLGAIAGGLALAFGVAGGAFAGTGNATIVSGTSSGSNTSLVTIGSAATDTTVLYATGTTTPGTFGALPVAGVGAIGAGTSPTNPYAANRFVNTATPSQTWSTPLTGSNWISPYVNSTNDIPTASGVSRGFYEYTTTVKLGAGQTQFTFNGKVLSQDSIYGVLVNGVAGTYTPGSGSPWSTPGTFSGSGTSSTGTATLTFIVKDDGTFDNRTGLDFSGTSVPEPATIAAFLIAMLGIAVMMFKNRKGQSSLNLA
jgi:hypothetical protein